MFGVRFKLTDQVNFSTDSKETETDISKDLFEKLKGLKDMLRLDLIISSFEQQCFHMNEELMSKNLFLQVYQLRKNSDF